MSIEIKKSHKDLLHKDLGVKSGDKISILDLHLAMNSKDPAERKRAQFALNARSWGK